MKRDHIIFSFFAVLLIFFGFLNSEKCMAQIVGGGSGGSTGSCTCTEYRDPWNLFAPPSIVCNPPGCNSSGGGSETPPPSGSGTSASGSVDIRIDCSNLDRIQIYEATNTFPSGSSCGQTRAAGSYPTSGGMESVTAWCSYGTDTATKTASCDGRSSNMDAQIIGPSSFQAGSGASYTFTGGFTDSTNSDLSVNYTITGEPILSGVRSGATGRFSVTLGANSASSSCPELADCRFHGCGSAISGRCDLSLQCYNSGGSRLCFDFCQDKYVEVENCGLGCGTHTISLSVSGGDMLHGFGSNAGATKTVTVICDNNPNPTPSCSCSWTPGNCGPAVGCLEGQRQRTRTCYPSGCGSPISQCVTDPTCSSDPGCTPGCTTTACSAECDGGTQLRICRDASCNETTTSQACNTQPCPAQASSGVDGFKETR